tara:strand:+ start:134 stop:601 length:468 start_codon:yes stop_codon:yes gene_type:complete
VVSTLKLTKIQIPNSDSDVLSFNASTGIMTFHKEIKAEGTATTNLQQGLQKNFLNMNGTGTIAIRDSFNTASITDIGTGNHSTTFTNSFRAVEYVFTGNLGHAGGSRTTGGVTFDDYTGSPDPSTSEYRFNTRRKDNAADTDCAYIMNQVSGDLA